MEQNVKHAKTMTLMLAVSVTIVSLGFLPGFGFGAFTGANLGVVVATLITFKTCNRLNLWEKQFIKGSALVGYNTFMLFLGASALVFGFIGCLIQNGVNMHL